LIGLAPKAEFRKNVWQFGARNSVPKNVWFYGVSL
jgi:hypothetical protein